MRYSDNGVSLIGPLEESAVMDAWPKVAEFISEALNRDGWKLDSEDVLSQIGDGLMGLYLIADDMGEILGAVVAEVQQYPKSSVFNIAYCGGRDLYRWANLISGMEAEAARFDCDTVRITGRHGWGRVFPDYVEMNRIFERKVLVK